MKAPNDAFWQVMKHLLATHRIVTDRPKGLPHPRYPETIYPLDYGYLENTSASDGGGIDVWIGSQDREILTGILCTFDTLKQDAEIKLLLGCDENDLHGIRNFYGIEMKTLYIPSELQ
jgi:inorganic pyrophosphatase